MLDPCESCGVPVEKMWACAACLDCRYNEENWGEPSEPGVWRLMLEDQEAQKRELLDPDDAG